MADVSNIKPYVLICRGNPLVSTSVVDIFTQRVRRYRHSARLLGGFWEASFFIPLGVGGTTKNYLTQWYENRLFHRIQEEVNGVISWEGFVWEMELRVDGYREKISMANVWNAVKIYYTNADNETQETAWYTNDTSISLYGRREMILTRTKSNQSTAEAAAQDFLLLHQQPQPQNLGFDISGEEGLFVQVVGDIFTANNKYVTAGDDTDDDLSAFLQEIIEDDCEFLSVGKIESNTEQVRKSFEIPTRAWDAILNLVDVGNGGTAPFFVNVKPGSRFHYEAASNSPTYEWRGSAGLVDLVGKRSPWTAAPGVIRNMMRKSGTPIPGSFLQDIRDSWVFEIQMADGFDDPLPKTGEFDPSEIMSAMEQNRRWLEIEERE